MYSPFPYVEIAAQAKEETSIPAYAQLSNEPAPENTEQVSFAPVSKEGLADTMKPGYPSVTMVNGDGSLGSLQLSEENIDTFIAWLQSFRSERQLKEELRERSS